MDKYMVPPSCNREEKWTNERCGVVKNLKNKREYSINNGIQQIVEYMAYTPLKTDIVK